MRQTKKDRRRWGRQFERSLFKHRALRDDSFLDDGQKRWVDPIVSMAVGQILSAQTERLLAVAKKLDKALESPIEHAMFWGLVCVTQIERLNLVLCDKKESKKNLVEAFNPDVWIELEPQFRVRSFRADFRVRKVKRLDEVTDQEAEILVECDGHDYHEKNETQITRDQVRDHIIQADGFMIVRFSGAEIWHDALGCARKVFSFFDGAKK